MREWVSVCMCVSVTESKETDDRWVQIKLFFDEEK